MLDLNDSGGTVVAEERSFLFCKVRLTTAFFIVRAVVALIVYLVIAWHILPPQALWSPDEGAKLLQAENLQLVNGTLIHSIAYPGRTLDPSLQFMVLPSLLRVEQSELYFQRLPLFPLLTLALFRWFGLYGLYLLPALAGAASGSIALQLLERDDRRFCMWILIAFASPIFVYSTIFWEHTLAVILGLTGTWLAFQIYDQARLSSYAIALGWVTTGILFGLSMYVRLEMLIYASALLIACCVVMREHRFGPIVGAVALGAMLLPYIPLHQLMFGQAIPGHALNLFAPLEYLQHARWRAVVDLLIGPADEGAIDSGWIGWLWATAACGVVLLNLATSGSVIIRRLRLVGLGITAVTGAVFLFSGAYYRSAHGLLLTTPWALLGLCRARDGWRRGGWRMRIIVLSMVIGLSGYALIMIGLVARSPHGGLEWGARYAMMFYPLLALIAAWDFRAPENDLRFRMIAAVLVLLGIGFQARGIWTIGHDKSANAMLNQTLLEEPEPNVVSDLWWMPLITAPIYPQKAVFFAPTAQRLKDWAHLAETHHIRQFQLVTLNRDIVEATTLLLGHHRLRVISTRQIEHVWVFRVEIEAT